MEINGVLSKKANEHTYIGIYCMYSVAHRRSNRLISAQNVMSGGTEKHANWKAMTVEYLLWK